MTVAVSAAGSTAQAPPRLGWGVLLRVFLRSLFLQAAWNPQGMQNLGLAYALYPALERLYPEKEKLNEAVRRHLVFFNTHPYIAAAIVGGVVFHEERISRGEEAPDRVVAFKAALMGPLAALGDGFFWLSLRPALGAFCAALVPVIQAWAVLLFLVLYNAVHFSLRAWLYWLGLRLGERLLEQVARASLPKVGAQLRNVAALSAGGVVAYLAMDFGVRVGGEWAPMLAAGCLLTAVVAYWLVGKGVPQDALLFSAAALAAVAGVLL